MSIGGFFLMLRIYINMIDRFGILRLILLVLLVLMVVKTTSFRCSYCKNIFKKHGLLPFVYVKRHGKGCEKYMKCPFCKTGGMCRHIPDKDVDKPA